MKKILLITATAASLMMPSAAFAGDYLNMFEGRPNKTVHYSESAPVHAQGMSYADPCSQTPAPTHCGAPVHHAPVQASQVVSAPSFDAPTFDAPTYSAPEYKAPTYNAPVFNAPVFIAPSFDAPTILGPQGGSHSSSSYGHHVPAQTYHHAPVQTYHAPAPQVQMYHQPAPAYHHAPAPVHGNSCSGPSCGTFGYAGSGKRYDIYGKRIRG